MIFDVFTALAASTAVVFLLSLVFAVFWLRNQKSPWLGCWTFAFLTIAIGNTMAMFAPALPRPVPYAAGSAVFFLGFALMWQATRIFEGRPPMWKTMVAVIGASAGVLAIPEIHGAASLRIELVSLSIMGWLLLAAWETWRGRGEGLPSKLAVATLLVGTALLLASRLPLGAKAAYPIGAQPTSDLVVILFIGGLIVASILLATFVISMSLERAEQGQRQLAATDSLTGLLNRRGLDAAFSDGKLPAGSALILFDLDRFKQVNDNFGHAAGDALIARFALICREELRQVDHAVRLGGEEFALVLYHTERPMALALAERIRERYARSVVSIDGGALAGTVSGGIFCAPSGAPVWLSGALAEADRIMYRAKAAGRNRVFDDRALARAPGSAEPWRVEPEMKAASVV